MTCQLSQPQKDLKVVGGGVCRSAGWWVNQESQIANRRSWVRVGAESVSQSGETDNRWTVDRLPRQWASGIRFWDSDSPDLMQGSKIPTPPTQKSARTPNEPQTLVRQEPTKHKQSKSHHLSLPHTVDRTVSWDFALGMEKNPINDTQGCQQG